MRFGLAPLIDNIKHEKTDLRNLVEKRKLNVKGVLISRSLLLCVKDFILWYIRLCMML